MKRIRKFPYLMPKPVALIGALVKGKPNFFTVADLCATAYKRYVISSGKLHYSNKGIIENQAFSVNIPSYEMVVKTDYYGMKSGKNIDKSSIFEVFYGEKLENVPMIKEAPIAHSCKLIKTVNFEITHYLFIGEIIETYVNEDFLTGNLPDIEKVKPFCWYNDNYYRKIGEKFAKAYQIGKKFEENK